MPLPLVDAANKKEIDAEIVSGTIIFECRVFDFIDR